MQANTFDADGIWQKAEQLIELGEEFGTPLYVYDRTVIERQYDRLSNAFSGLDLRIKYACKALPNLNILELLLERGSGLDTVSLPEVKLGLMAGFKPDQIIFTPNCVSFEEIKAAVDLGVVINIDNISILEQFGHTYGASVPVCVRINPHIMAGGNIQISTGHVDSKFGISFHQLRHLERVVKSTGLQVHGLHMHTGSDILDTEVFLRGAEILFECAEHFPDLRFMDFGSGFKVPYEPNEISTNVEELGKRLGERFKTFCKSYGRELELWFEPGKFLVSESGVFLAKANVIKTTTATVFVGVDSGMNHLIRPMLYNTYHHIVNLSNPKGTERIYTVVGYICETDTFGWDRSLNEVREGDLIAIMNAGAYGMSMASNYNSRLRPAEVLIEQDGHRLIRRREEMEDLIKNQVWQAAKSL